MDWSSRTPTGLFRLTDSSSVMVCDVIMYMVMWEQLAGTMSSSAGPFRTTAVNAFQRNAG